MNDKRREFFKFLAAAPAALVAPLLSNARPLTEVQSRDILIRGNNVTLANSVINNSSVTVEGGHDGPVVLSGLYIKNDSPSGDDQ